MKARKIESADVKELLVSSLPTRPTAPRSLGGMGYGAKEMKDAFDRLPLYVIEKYNDLIADIGRLGKESLAGAMPTGIKEGHTVADLCDDVASGALATYLTFLGKSLSEHVAELYRELDEISKTLERLEGGKEE